MTTTTLSHGPVSVAIPETLAIDPRAGNLSADDVKRLAKAPRGLGLATDLTAAAMEQAGDRCTPPTGVTPTALRRLGTRAEGYDEVLLALDVVRQTLAQGNLIADAEAWEALRKVNDMVKAQAAHSPELVAMFAPLSGFMGKGKK